MTAAEQRDAFTTGPPNCLPELEAQSGISLAGIGFSVVPIGGSEYVVARALRMGTHARDPDRWWVLDPDRSWIAQAVYTPDGFINHSGDDRLDVFPDEEADSSLLPPPRDPHAPVTVSIDLEEHEAAEREGITTWEPYDGFSVLVTEQGFSVIYDNQGTGIVRYPDKTACIIKCGNVNEAREQAEKFLAKRPYRSAYDRVLGGPSFDEEDPAPKAPSFEAPTNPAIPRPKPAKRVWSTVPIKRGEEDDD
jgi:hypothetical protein